MKRPELILLLTRIRDDLADAEELALAMDAVAGDEGIPDEVRAAPWDEPAAHAAGLLALMGVDDLFGDALSAALHAEAGPGPGTALEDGWDALGAVLREGLSDEARGVDVSDGVLALLGGASRAPVAEAVRAEAGTVDLGGAVDTSLALGAAVRDEAGSVDVADDVALSLAVAEALRAEAGTIDVAEAVMAALGAERAVLSAAVRDEAGTVEVAPAVLARLGADELPIAAAVRAEAGTVDVVDGVLRSVRRSALSPTVVAPVPANRPSRWWQPALALAAAALLSVVGVRSWVGTPHPAAYELQFASAAEIIVDELDYGASVDVHVYQAEDDNAPLIIWVDEETI